MNSQNSQPVQVLLIEDNPGDARLLCEFLDPLQFHVTYAQRLSQAMQYLDAAPSDVILLDLSLPDSADLKTVQHIHAHAPGTPIVVLTGRDDEALALQAVRDGAQDYLAKGQADREMLTRAIRYAIERKHAEQALQQRNRELALLYRAGQTFNSTLDLDQVLIRVLEELSDQIRAVGTFWLTDHQTGELVCRQASGPFGETVRGWRLQPGQGIVGWVAQHGEGLVVADMLSDPRHFTEIDQHTGMQPRSTLCVPLKRKNLVVGVLQLLDTAVGRFGAADLELVEALAATATIAIENARLYEAVRQGEARYRLLAENATDVIWTVDLNMQITYVSPSVTRLLGFTIEEAMARTMQQAYTPATFEKAKEMFAEEMALERAGRGDPKRSRTLELELYRKDGGTVPVEANFGFLSDATGQPTGILAIVRDITARKRAEDALRALSLTDDLTGLYNRRGFLMLAEQQFRMAKRAQRPMLLLFADIDGLKKINDTWGHSEGDRALIEAAHVLKNTFREADIVARLSGDEFVAMPLETQPGAPEAVPVRLQTNLAILNAEENRRYALSLSNGVATFDPAHPCSIEELLAKADAAMYEQKQRKRTCATNDAR